MKLLKRIDYLGRFTSLFVLGGVFLSILSIALFSVQQLRLQDVVDIEKGESVLELKQQGFKNSLNHFEALLHAINNNRFFMDYLRENTPQNYQNSIDTFCTVVQSDQRIMQLRYLDETGQERIRIDRTDMDELPARIEGDRLQNKSRRDYFLESSKNSYGQLYISKLDLNIEHGKIEVPYKPVLRFALPVFEEGERRGIVIVNIFMENILEELTASQLFYLYLYDDENCLLYSNDPARSNWTRYHDQQCTFDTAGVLLEREAFKVSDQETLHIGLVPIESQKDIFGNMLESILFLILFIIPAGIVIAFFLAKIPKRLYDELEEQQKMLLQQSKLAAMGEMIGAIAHQWRQPLNAIGVLVQELQLKIELDALKRGEAKALSEELQQYLEYMSKTIDDFRDFFKPSKQKAPFDIIKAIETSLAITKKHLQSHDIDVSVDAECKAANLQADARAYVIEGYESEFKQVLINIINNAREAIEEQSTTKDLQEKWIHIHVVRTEKELIITVQDNGGGIPEEILQDIFEPYHSTKYAQQGTGLGLYMSKLIIERNMQGLLSARNTSEGAAFEIILRAD
ncbi:ATP-binding protein [Sulfurimonas sp. HSL3-7]|uniref:sensor histidine kinase n=1 Tax=Sulfonitrofixus jiaomeiensis TaxID=3131938 RepID=UPI0031F920CC